jgi:ABC-type Fe3+ transport system substrate-binding protein
MTDTDDVWAAQALGKDVQLVYPAHNIDASVPGSGTLLIPNTVARIKGAPHSAQAAKLMDYLLSEKVERMLAESPSHNIPLRPSLALAFPKYAVPNPLKVNYQEAANLRLGAIEQLMNAVEEHKALPRETNETREPASRPEEPFPPLKDGAAP